MEEKEKNNKNMKIIIIVVVVVLALIIGNNIIKQRKRDKIVDNLRQSVSNVDQLRNLTVNGGLSNTTNLTVNGGLSNTTNTSNETIEYINNYFVLENAVVKQFTSYSDKKEWGLSNIQVKNNGDKTVTGMTITVYFQDTDGKDVAEDSFNISQFNSLKPNYSWKQDEDRYYQFKNLTSDVDPTRHTIKVTDLEFE